MIDPAFGMPQVNWQPTSSYSAGEIPPASDPDGGNLICIPPINRDWLPFILGSMTQLQNPATWIVADDNAMVDTLARVDKLMSMIGGRAVCNMPGTYAGNCLADDVTFAANTLTTILTLDVVAGEYDLTVDAVVAGPDGAAGVVLTLWDGATLLRSSESTTASAGYVEAMSLSAHVAPTATTTYTLKAETDNTHATILADTARYATGVKVATCINAFPLGSGPPGPPGAEGPCTLVRFTTDCELQTSCDAGATWSTAPGWDAYFGTCVQANTPITGPPPNPGGDTHDALACAIASYLANQVILAAMQAGVTTIQDNLTLLSLGLTISNLIPEFIFVRLGLDAISVVYTGISEGTLSDYEAALTNDTLWTEVTCAIYLAIQATGYVTAANFVEILTNISAISYAHASVVSTIHDYVNSLGATGLAQLSQRAGLVVGMSCDCGSGAWCTWWGAAGRDLCNGDWTGYVQSGIPAPSCAGGVFTAVVVGGGGAWCDVETTLAYSRTITCVRVDVSATGSPAFLTTMYDAAGTQVFQTAIANWVRGSGPGPSGPVSRITLNISDGAGVFTIGSIKVGGPDSGSPWGQNNGVCD